MNDLIRRAALHIIAESAFHCTKDDLKSVADEFTVINKLPQNVLILLVPLLKFLPLSERRAIDKARKNLGEYVLSIAEQIKSEGSIVDGTARAIIDYLVQSEELTTDDLRDHSLTFMFAGFESTTNTLQWTLAILAEHKIVQQKLYETLSTIAAPGTCPDIDTLQSCVYLNNCINESMRLSPVVPVISRDTVDDDVLPFTKVVVPAGTTVLLSIHGAHRNPAVFGADADKFRPERWDDPTLKERIGVCGFFPFSAGPRNCIGKEFALNELLILLSILVRNFEFNIRKEDFPTRKFGVTMQPTPYNMTIRAREE